MNIVMELKKDLVYSDDYGLGLVQINDKKLLTFSKVLGHHKPSG